MTFKYTSEQLNFLKKGYLSRTGPELTKAFNKKFGTSKSVKAIYTLLKRYKYKSGRTGCYSKGESPWNKGTKGIIKPNKGNFKKGDIPANIKPIGSERICPKDGFILIKIAETDPYTGAKTRYKHKHLFIWEKEKGPIPKGMVVAFKDGNKENCTLENLMLISRAELLRLNNIQYKNTPDELKPSVLLLTKLQVKTWEKEKNNKGEINGK
ncbi:MAG: HNH endonuclease [Desulfobacterales bacterium]|nr:HNH endonuclease [Desulfobacterales bacterium]